MPIAVVIALGVVGLLLIALTVASLGAWYGIYLQREEDRQRLIRGSWTCDECGQIMRFVGHTVDHDGRQP